MKRIIMFLTILFLCLTVNTKVQAQYIPFPTFPPCFPFCYLSPTPTRVPTPSPTPRPTVTPTPRPSISPTNTPTPTSIVTPTPTGVSQARIYYGAYVGDGFDSLSNVTNFENEAQKNLAVVMWYQAWGVSDDSKNFKPTWMNNVRNHGSIPMVTWEPWNYTAGVNQPTYSLQAIINGNHDTYIRKWAQDSKAWGKPYFLRFAHEMNGNWYPWAATVNGNTAQRYIDAWKHIHDIFVQEGANNTTWVWCPNVSYTGSTALNTLYPGDQYVDWTCIDGYNWGDINGGWQTFTNLFSPTYNQILALSQKPMMIGETASAEVGGSKANWITNAYGSAIDSMPQIKLINWFNANKEKDWRINSSTSARNSFRTAISAGKYATNTYGSLNTNPIPQP